MATDELVHDAASSVQSLAERLIEDAHAPSAHWCASTRVAVAWALKDICYGAWNTAPARAVQAAAALRRLCADGGEPEVVALADWTTGIASLTRAELPVAIEQLDAAAAGFRALGRARDGALTQVPKVMALSMLGEHGAAANCAEATQAIFVAEGDLLSAAKVNLNLGSLHMLRDAYAQAARQYRAASVQFARAGNREHSVMADFGLADALTALGDFDESLRIYARACMRAQAHGLDVLAAHGEESIALLHSVRGHYTEALAGMERARQRYESLAMPQRAAVAEKQLADLYLELNLLPEALAMFDAALATFDRLGLRDEQAGALVQRGRALAWMRRTDAARQDLADAEARYLELGNAVGVAHVALARAVLALSTGRVTDAIADAERAAHGFDTEGHRDGRWRADLVGAQAQLRSGQATQAAALFDDLLARAQAMQLQGAQAQGWTGKGLAAASLDDAHGARLAFERAVELFEDQRAALPDHDLRRAFLADHLLPFRELLRLDLQAHHDRPDDTRARAVLAQIDRVRALSMHEQLSRREREADDDGMAALRVRLNWLVRRVQQRNDEGEPATALLDDLRDTEHRLIELARRHRIRGSAERRPGIAGAPQPAQDLGALVERLRDGDALVEFGVLDDELFACIVTAAGVRVQRRMASWQQVVAALQSARFQVETLRHGSAPMVRHLDTLHRRMHARLGRLHALIWAPLAHRLRAIRRLMVVPHGPLGALPFGALHDGGPALAEQLQIAVAPSARLAADALARPLVAPRRLLALGESSRLPHARREVHQVAALFDVATTLVGADATLERLLPLVGDADVLHLACHAQFRHDNPRFSALHLRDGVLSAEAAQALSLKPGICVLSACETALAEQGEVDDMVGLVRAFMAGGAARVLASLWPIDDAVTADYMTAFYTALRAGSAPAAAVQAAQRVVRERHAHPYYWSAFALYGGW